MLNFYGSEQRGASVHDGPIFEKLNLRWNPFGEPSPAERIELAVVDRPVPCSGRVVQYLGEAGHGKTTRLLATLGSHPSARYHYLADGDWRLPFSLKAGQSYLIDEAQRLNRFSLRNLLSGRYAVVIASHEDLTRYARVPVETRWATTDARALQEIFKRRIEWARRCAGPIPTLSVKTVASLVGLYGHNIRAMEGQLYEVFQGLEKIGDVEMRR